MTMPHDERPYSVPTALQLNPEGAGEVRRFARLASEAAALGFVAQAKDFYAAAGIVACVGLQEQPGELQRILGLEPARRLERALRHMLAHGESLGL